jgi:MFS family permease
VQVLALAIYAQLGTGTSLAVVVIGSVVNGLGAGGFFPANNTAVMRVAPERQYGVASGMLRTFANTGMVFSYSIAILIAAHAVTRSTAFAIFVGSRTLQPRLASAFASGAHAAFYASMGFMAAAALLSALRGRHASARQPLPRENGHAPGRR